LEPKETEKERQEASHVGGGGGVKVDCDDSFTIVNPPLEEIESDK
jgi:hypothetical protein